MMGALVAIIGWATLIVGGAFVAAMAAFIATGIRGGPDALGRALTTATLAGAAWAITFTALAIH